MRFFQTRLVSVLGNHIVMYPTPVTLNYWWSFGSLAGIMLVVQIVTGIFLSMHYVANVNYAFDSVEHIMRDVNAGWLLRYMHANGASFFFIVVYLHIVKAFWYKSYRYHPWVWKSGILIFLLLMGTAFIGYVLPWGQMSFWGATVITNLVTVIPGVGPHIAYWLWGGFAVDNATLNRFFSFHYLLPFILVAIVVLHLILLHEKGSTNPLAIRVWADKTTFHPYFTIKDVLGLQILILVYMFFVFYVPNLLGHPDNYIDANPLVTPAHIVPEWYFLPFYAILRSIPDKVGGVILMFLSILVFLFIVYFDQTETSCAPKFRLYFLRVLLCLWFGCFVLLGWVGAQPAEEPFVTVGQLATLGYWLYPMFLFVYSIFRTQDIIKINKN